MVELVKPQKDKFWKALVLTVIVFLTGVSLGYYLESGRIAEVQEELDQLLIEWDDAKTQGLYFQNLDKDSCSRAVEENFIFGDKIYRYGLTLEKYEQANRLTSALVVEKTKYTLLKLQFLINSMSLKEQCDEDYKFVIYFFQDDPDNIDVRNKQKVVSRVLGDLKEERGNDIILVPLAADFDLAVVNILIDTYNIQEFPSVLIDEKVVLTHVPTLEELNSLLQ